MLESMLALGQGQIFNLSLGSLFTNQKRKQLDCWHFGVCLLSQKVRVFNKAIDH